MFIGFFFAIIFEIIGTIVFRMVFVFSSVIFGFATTAVILTTGVVLKYTGKKYDRRNQKIYSNVLLVSGGIYTILSIVYAVYAFGAELNIGSAYVNEDMKLILSGTAVICSAFVLIPGIFGVLLELIYRNTQKPALRIISVILFVLTAFALVISIALMILAAYGVKAACGV